MSPLKIRLHGCAACAEAAPHAVESREELETERSRKGPAFRTGGRGAAGAMMIHDISADGTAQMILQSHLLSD